MNSKSFDELMIEASIGRTECALLNKFNETFDDYAMCNLEIELDNNGPINRDESRKMLDLSAWSTLNREFMGRANMIYTYAMDLYFLDLSPYEDEFENV